MLFVLACFFLSPLKVKAVSETRYLRSDTQTVNTLTAYQLGTTQSASGLSTNYRTTNSGNLTCYWGIRVWKRSSSGTEVEITSGTPVAQVSRGSSASGMQSNTWAAPATELALTDSIIVRVYIQVGSLGWVQGGTAPNFTTTQLNNSLLDGATWTVNYYTIRTSATGGGKFTQADFWWGTSTYNSNIASFTRTTQNITVGTTGTQTTNIIAGASDAYVGGAFTLIRDSRTADVTSITVSQTGTVTSANLANLILFYKTEAACSASLPGDATQFNSTPGSFTAGSSTVTGTISVTTSQICLYITLNVGGGATAGQTIEIQITNPSTQVLVTNGTTSPGTAVAISGTTTIIVGSLSLNIVDGSDVVVGSPSYSFSSKTFSWSTGQTTASLGSSSQKIKISNTSATPSWTLSIAATGGNTALWTSGGNSYDFNGTASAGRLQLNPLAGTITPGTGCNNTGLTLQSAAYFVHGSADSLNLLSAGGTAQTSCHWYLTAVGMTQDIPASQATGTYNLAMTLTLL